MTVLVLGLALAATLLMLGSVASASTGADADAAPVPGAGAAHHGHTTNKDGHGPQADGVGDDAQPGDDRACDVDEDPVTGPVTGEGAGGHVGDGDGAVGTDGTGGTGGTGGKGGEVGEQSIPPPAVAPLPPPAPSAGAEVLGSAATAPATATSAFEPAAAGLAAADPGALEAATPVTDITAALTLGDDAPAPTAAATPSDADALDGLAGMFQGALADTTPRAAAAPLIPHAPESLAAVAALLLAVILFLVFHGAGDRRDARLAEAAGTDDLARFR